MIETTTKEMQEIADELEKRHGKSIEDISSEMCERKPGAIGTAVTYFACGCVLLRCFDEDGDTIGIPGIIASKNSCGVDHTEMVEDDSHVAIYNSILWKAGQEEFDRTYGNEQRIVIAGKLFPPQEDE